MSKAKVNDTFYMGAYWGDRRESLDACAERLTNFLLELRRCDKVFQEWSKGGRSLKDALSDSNKVPVEINALREFLNRKGAHRTYNGSKVMEDVGFTVCLWNCKSRTEGKVGLSVSCGLYAGVPGLVNRCVISLPEEGPVMERITHIEKLVEILSVVIRAWEPDWAIVTSHSIIDTVGEAPPRVPEPAWILFLSEGRGKIPFLPLPSRTILLEGVGTIIVVIDERFDSTREDHIKAAKKVYRILKKAGLLAPIPQAVEHFTER